MTTKEILTLTAVGAICYGAISGAVGVAIIGVVVLALVSAI